MSVNPDTDRVDVVNPETGQVESVPRNQTARQLERVPPNPTLRAADVPDPDSGSIARVCHAAPDGATIVLRTAAMQSEAEDLANELGKTFDYRVSESQSVAAIWRAKPGQKPGEAAPKPVPERYEDRVRVPHNAVVAEDAVGPSGTVQTGTRSDPSVGPASTHRG